MESVLFWGGLVATAALFVHWLYTAKPERLKVLEKSTRLSPSYHIKLGVSSGLGYQILLDRGGGPRWYYVSYAQYGRIKAGKRYYFRFRLGRILSVEDTLV